MTKQQEINEELNKINTASERIHVLNNDDPPPPIEPSGFIDDGVILSYPDKSAFIFTAPMKVNGQFIAFSVSNGIVSMMKSQNGLNNWILTPTNALYMDIFWDGTRFVGNYGRWNVDVLGRCNTESWASLDGINWSKTHIRRQKTEGEDRTTLQEGSDILCIVRPDTPSYGPRSIGFMRRRVSDWNWYGDKVLMRPQDNIYDNIRSNEYYMMSVISYNSKYYGLLTEYNAVDGGITRLRLAKANIFNGTWEHSNNNQPIINLPSGHKQMFGRWGVIGDEAWIYTIERKSGHDETSNGSFFYSKRFRIKLSELANIN